MAILLIVQSQSTGNEYKFTYPGLATFEGSLCYGAKEANNPYEAAADMIEKFKRIGLKGVYQTVMVDTQSYFNGIGKQYHGYQLRHIKWDSFKADECKRSVYVPTWES